MKHYWWDQYNKGNVRENNHLRVSKGPFNISHNEEENIWYAGDIDFFLLKC